MTDFVISVENLNKSYLVGHNKVPSERYTTLRDVLTHNARNLARKTRDMFQSRPIVQGDEVEEFWALKDVSFDIKKGDRVGIIGRNGAGKSTLLKILSRITEPTKGHVQINGRVASLLEVGTGFHPELTGLENIYLNGAILGMSRREMNSKLNQIVDFSEVGNFLDTPVKRYSSGMYLRLAFAIAAHLDPEILILDEVLTVGDAEFQKKCLRKIDSETKKGTTILLVSHNMSAIKDMCDIGIVLNKGKLIYNGDISEAINNYHLITTNAIKRNVAQKPDAILEVIFPKGLNYVSVALGETASVFLRLRLTSMFENYHVAINIRNRWGELIAHLINEDNEFRLVSTDEKHEAVLTVKMRHINISPGDYQLDVWLGQGGSVELDRFDSCGELRVFNDRSYIRRFTPYPPHAKCAISSEWTYAQ